MSDPAIDACEAAPPWPIGTKLRYWPVGGTPINVEVVGYTQTGRVRVRWAPNVVGYRHIGAVKATSLSVI